MIDMKPIYNKTEMTIPDLIDLLKNEPDGIYRIFLNNEKMYQAIKSNGEVTTLVNSIGDVFRRNKRALLGNITPGWVEVDRLVDINTFLLIAQVKGWI